MKHARTTTFIVLLTLLAVAAGRVLWTAGRGPARTPQDEPAIVRISDTGPLRLAMSQAFLRRGLSALEAGDLPAAIESYSDALAADPKNAAIHYLRGTAYWHGGILSEAIADLTQAIRLSGKAPYYFSRCGAYFAVGEWDAAISDCTETIRAEPMESEAYFLRAASHYAKGDLERAMADSLLLLMIHPNDPNARHLIDEILAQREARNRELAGPVKIRTDLEGDR